MNNPANTNAFSISRFDNDVYLIREKHIAWWLRCNIWLIKGRDLDLVIDTGLGIWPLRNFMAEYAADRITAISTHSHFDHMGGAHEFEYHLGHANEAHVYAAAPGQGADFFPFIRAETFLSQPWPGFQADSFRLRPAPLTGYLDDGDVLDLGNRHFQVLHVPGHSPGSIALYEEKTGILFSGDIIYDGDLIDNAEDCNLEEYKRSLARLGQLPLNTVHAGHFDSFDRNRLKEIVHGYHNGGFRIDDCCAWVEQKIRD